MITSKQAEQYFGNPKGDAVRKHLKLYTIPVEITSKIPCIPKRIYCNKLLYPLLIEALKLVIFRGLESEIKTFDGCYNVRPIRGYKDIWSIHSWAIAIDINAKTNGLGKVGDMSPELVECFKSCGFDWGGDFERLDMMHMQLHQL